MGVLQRFERRLEGLVEGAFAKVFKGVVEPIEVAKAMQREAESRKAIVGPGHIVVPNDFTVELGSSDHARLAPYDEHLTRELAAMVKEHAQEEGWTFPGPVAVRLQRDDDLDTGVFRVRSQVREAPDHGSNRVPQPEAGRPNLPGRPRLLMSAGGTAMLGTPQADAHEEVLELAGAVTVIGRAHDADLRLEDTGVSRHHAELRLDGTSVVLVDLGSTNGTRVNGRPVTRAILHDNDRLTVGETALVFRQEATSAQAGPD